MKKKIWEFLLTLMISSLLLSKTAGAWENEWAIYKNLDLSPDETKVVFERCWFFQGTGCDDSVKGNDIYVVDITGRNLEKLTTAVGGVRWLSPDKSKMFFRMHGEMYMVDLDTKVPLKRLPKSGWIVQLSWSPNSKEFLMTTGADSFHTPKASLIDAQTFEETTLEPSLASVELPFQWSSDGSSFVYSIPRPFPEIYYLNLTSMTGDLLASGDWGERTAHLEISPDDKKILYKYKDYYKIQFVDLSAERRRGRLQRRIICREVDLPAWAYQELSRPLWSEGGSDVLEKMDHVLLQVGGRVPFSLGKTQVIWSPDAQELVIKGRDQLWVYNIPEDKFTPLWRDTSSTITDILFDPNQRRIFFLSLEWENLDTRPGFTRYDEGFTNLNILSLDGGNPETIVSRTDLDNHLRFSSDGKILAFEKDNNIWLLNVESNDAVQLTSSGGENGYWLKDDKEILFVNGGSLYTIGIDGTNLMRLTMDNGMQPVWLNDNEIAVKSRGKYWKIILDRLRVTEMSVPPEKTPRTEGKKYEVYIKQVTSGSYPMTLTEIWAKEIETSKSWKVVEAYKNW